MDEYYQVKVVDEDEDKNILIAADEVKISNNCSSLYMITHLILSFFAIYLSWKCSNMEFSPLHFIAALCCPHIYIIWALAVHGGCGIFNSVPQPVTYTPWNPR